MMLVYRFSEYENQILVYYQFAHQEVLLCHFNFEFIVYYKFFNISMLFAEKQRLEFTFVGCHLIMIKPLNAYVERTYALGESYQAYIYVRWGRESN